MRNLQYYLFVYISKANIPLKSSQGNIRRKFSKLNGFICHHQDCKSLSLIAIIKKEKSVKLRVVFYFIKYNFPSFPSLVWSIFNFRFEAFAEETIVFGSIVHESSVKRRCVLFISIGSRKTRR